MSTTRVPRSRQKPINIFVGDDGSISYVYDDEVDRFFRGAGFEGVVRRASRVEPCEGGWSADLALVGGPVLGPFEDRAQAIAEEVEWLNRNLHRVPNEFYESEVLDVPENEPVTDGLHS